MTEGGSNRYRPLSRTLARARIIKGIKKNAILEPSSSFFLLNFLLRLSTSKKPFQDRSPTHHSDYQAMTACVRPGSLQAYAWDTCTGSNATISCFTQVCSTKPPTKVSVILGAILRHATGYRGGTLCITLPCYLEPQEYPQLF